MLIGIISDTHGHVDRTLEAVRLFESVGVERAIHCGDIGNAAIVEVLSRWPCDFVLGNCDDRGDLLAAFDGSTATCHDRFGQIELEGRRIAFLHGDDRARFDQTVNSGHWHLVCYGHTHKPEARWAGRTLVLNPGAIYRSARPSVAAVRLPQLEVIAIGLNGTAP